MKKLFLIALSCLLTVIQPSYADDILSKEDASKTFSLSFVEWVANLERLHRNNFVKVAVVTEYEWTMLVSQEKSILKVTPSYLKEDLKKPHKISTSVEHGKEASKLLISLNDSQLKDIIFKWYREMLPEYTVMTEFDLKDGTAQVNFSLFEVGRYPEIDALAKQTRGCWKDCVKR